jgi:uncharacterized membrane protein
MDQAVTIGLVAGTLGLLVNATYIDVFAASKVAYTYWFFAGLVRANNMLNIPTKVLKNKQKKKHVHH